MNRNSIVILSQGALRSARGFHTIIEGYNATDSVAHDAMRRVTGVIVGENSLKVFVRWHGKKRDVLQAMERNDIMLLPQFSLHEDVIFNGALVRIIGVHERGCEYTIMRADGVKVVADVRDISKVHEVS